MTPRWVVRSTFVLAAAAVAVSIGMAFVLWLVFAELVLVGAICVWCTTMHILTFALFVLIVVFGYARDPAEPEPIEEQASDATSSAG